MMARLTSKQPRFTVRSTCSRFFSIQACRSSYTFHALNGQAVFGLFTASCIPSHLSQVEARSFFPPLGLHSGVYFWPSASPTLGCYFLPLQNKVQVLSCPLSLPPLQPRRHYVHHHHHHHFHLDQHNHFSNKSTTKSDFSKSTSTIKWLEAKAKASAEKVVAQRIRVRRVRNPTARRLACRFVCPLFCITFSLSRRLSICDLRLHRSRIYCSENDSGSTRFANIRLRWRSALEGRTLNRIELATCSLGSNPADAPIVTLSNCEVQKW
jgi:hypothetical protein